MPDVVLAAQAAGSLTVLRRHVGRLLPKMRTRKGRAGEVGRQELEGPVGIGAADEPYEAGPEHDVGRVDELASEFVHGAEVHA